MKKILTIALGISVILGMTSCKGFLDTDPKDRVLENEMFTTDAGIAAYMAGLYRNLPIEDGLFSFCQDFFTWRPGTVGATNMQAGVEAAFPHYNDHVGEQGRFGNWETIYKSIRLYCEFGENIAKMTPTDPSEIDRMKGEQAFMMAYSYFALARRYGGVPLITEPMQFNGSYEGLYLSRATEVETWKFILKLCDDAVALLPDTTAPERANKWSAYALKSRAALFAASVGKFWSVDNIALSGEAVNLGYVGGFTPSDIEFFYTECAKASAAVINSGKFELSGAEPGSLEEATENYRKLFIEPEKTKEAIFVRRYNYPGFAHNLGKNLEPWQISDDWGGRCNPTLDMVESYQVIDPVTRFGTYDVKLETTTDGNESYDCVVKGDMDGKSFKRYDNWSDIYANRDPRLYGTIILPYTQWGGTTIIIQGGIVGEDGEVKAFKSNETYTFNGETYYGLGASADRAFSGFKAPNATMSGFLLKKYLKGDGSDQVWDQVTTPFLEFRYAEILLNYAEAVAEGGVAEIDGISAKDQMNAVRKRAGFLDEKPLTAENLRKERRSEFGLEQYHTVWDYLRRREFHNLFNNSRKRMGLVPMLDFSSGEKKCIFVRSNTENGNQARYFEPKVYYRPIPGIDNNHLVQNPNY